MVKRIYDHVDWKEAGEKYKNGATLESLSIEYRIPSARTVRRYLTRYNPDVIIRTTGESKELKREQLDWEEIHKEYETDPMCSLREIAKRHLVSRSTVSRYFKKFGFKFKTTKQVNKMKTEKTKQIMLEKYGVECSLQIKKIREKGKRTMLERYGKEHPMQNEQIKEKIKQTNLKNFGFEYASQNEGVKEKIKQSHLNRSPKQIKESEQKRIQTNLQKYGTEYGFQNEEVREKIKQTNIEEYGFENPMQNKEIQEKARQTSFLKFPNKFKILHPEYEMLDDFRGYTDKNSEWIEYKFKHKKCGTVFLAFLYSYQPKCPICFPIRNGKSNLEQIFYDFIKNILGIDNVERNVRILYDLKTKGYKEIDIYLPDYKIGFEINGVYWHSSIYGDKDYHTLKQNLAKKQGIRLFHIWETKNIEIYKSIIRNLLDKVKNRIYARKCIVKKVDKQDAEIFLMQNHINGYAISSLHFGLYYEDELVSIICFRKNEISRFASILNTIVVGGFSKLLKHSLKELNYKFVTTYCDKEFCVDYKDSVYYKNGFEFIKETKPKLYYTDFKQIYNRQKFMKHKLKDMKGYDEQLTADEILSINNIYPLYSVGNWKFKILI